MTYDLYAHCCVATFETKDGVPTALAARSRYDRILVANYSSKLLAQWWGINLKRVWLDAEKTILVPATHIHLYEIVEVP
jgi:hypothetical protein